MNSLRRHSTSTQDSTSWLHHQLQQPYQQRFPHHKYRDNHTLVHIHRIRHRMHHPQQCRHPRNPLMKHMERPIRPARQPDQKVVSPRQEEENRHIPQGQHARAVRNQLAAVDLQRGAAGPHHEEDDIDEPVAGHQQRLHPRRERVPPDWLSVPPAEQCRVHQPSLESVRERTWRIHTPGWRALGLGVGGEAAKFGITYGGPDGSGQADGEEK